MRCVQPTVRRVMAQVSCLLAVLFACSGCFTGSPPSASRIRSDTNDRHYPQGEIHFVEQGQRSKGVLVSATEGFEHAFRASWSTMLVPTPPTALQGPVWTGRKVRRDEALAIAGLPKYRNVHDLTLTANSARSRSGEQTVWILGTDPLVVGLPAGEPKRTWGEFATAETGIEDAGRTLARDTFRIRFVTQRDLNQPLSRVVVYRPELWHTELWVSAAAYLSLVTLPKPLTIDQALNALATGGPAGLAGPDHVRDGSTAPNPVERESLK